ncbi:MAG: gliding motility-associated C-terminal domain-containing protein [Sphingobacteriales bacterium]|nr:MAG: gliding motility-associated C-terminal domain-containing protein [Sphingobacteriales bacterium]
MTANKTYYVEATLGTCASPTRTAVNLTVNPRPVAPTVTTSSASVNPGQTVVLTASSPTVGVNFNWYTSATSNTPIFTGDTFVTPPLAATTSYFVETVSTVSGCSSLNRVQVTVTVNNSGGPTTVPCEAPISQTNAVSGVLAVLAGVSNAQLAIDDNTQTGSTLLMPVGVGAYVYQRLNFGSSSNLGDSVKVLISSPGRLLGASLLGGVQISTRNGGVDNADIVTINDPLIRLELLSGTNQALVTFVPTALFDEVEIRLNSGLVGALTSINVNYGQRVIKAPTVASNNVNGCVSQPVTLTVTNSAVNLVYKWYDAAGVYQANMDGTSFTIPSLTGNTSYFVEATSPTGCASARTKIDITATALANTPTLVASNINTCSGSNVSLQVSNPQSGITYRWYNAAGTYLTGQDGATLAVTGVTANTSYAVEAVNTCGIASTQRATATITVGTVDPPIVAQTTVSVTAGTSAVLSATSSIQGTTFNWYDVPLGGTAIAMGPTFVTGPITANKSFYVETSGGLCPPSVRVRVDVIVVPTGTPETLPCGYADTSVDAGISGLALGNVSNPNLAVDNLGQTASSLSIALGAVNAYAFQRVSFPGGASRIGDTLTVRLSSPGKLLSLAVLQQLSLTTYLGNNSNTDVLIINNPLINLELLSDNSAIIVRYVPTAIFDGVELRLSSGLIGALTSIDLNYALRTNQMPQVVANTASACVGTSTTLAVSNPVAGVTYRWYLENVNQNQDGPLFQVPTTLAAGTYNYFVRAFYAGCESAGSRVIVTILAPPLPPVATETAVTACGNAPVTLSVQPVAGVRFNWYDANGNVLVVNNANYTPPANLAPGIYQYFVEAVNGNSCTNSTRTNITLTVNPTSTADDITVTGITNLCGTATTSLTASSTTVTLPVFKWYSDASLTNLLFTGPTYAPIGLTATTNFYVTVSGTDKCDNLPAGAKVVTVNVNPTATPNDIALAGNTTVCIGNSVTLTATSSTVTAPIFSWYNDASLTQKVFEGASFATGALTATTTYYVTVKGDNKCENASGNGKAITVTVNPSATANDILVNGDLDICSTSQTVLTASSNTIANPVFTWYSDAGLTNPIITGAVLNTGSLTANTTYYVTVSGDNTCESDASAAKSVTVIVNPFATAADISLANANICAGGGATLVASSFTVDNPVFTWYSDASLTNAIFTGPTYLTGPLTTNTTYYVTVKGTNKCENKAIDAKVVVVSVNGLATSTDLIVNGNTTICAGGTVNLSATSPSVDDAVFTWYADPALTNLVFIGANFTSQALFTNTTYYVTVKGSNRCENDASTAKIVTITVTARPNTPVVANTGRNICGGETTTLTIENPEAGVSYQWYDAATGGTLVHTGPSYLTPILTASTSYYVQAVNAGNCQNVSGRVLVTVTVTPRPAVPTVNSSNITVCVGNTVVLTVTNPATGATYNWFTTSLGGTAVGTGVSFTTPGITANVTYYVEASNGACFATGRTTVNITAQALPIAPANVTAANATLCTGGSTTLTVINPDPALFYRWYANSSGGSMLAEGTSYTPTNITTTTIYYVESVAVTGGCASATRTPVTVTVLPILATPIVRVQSADATSVIFAWSVVDGATAYEVSKDGGITWTSQSGNTFTVVGLKPDETVSILVRAKGQIDCQTSANAGPIEGKSTNPFADQLYIPNTFTPNGDGKNDIFLAYGNAVSKFKMRVYNQWGEYLFESNSLDAGWDGRYRGNLQPNGVYVYYVDVTFNSGAVKQFKGTITLLR